MRIRLGYPGPDDEIAILDSQQYVHPLTQIEQVVDVEELTAAQEKLKDVYRDWRGGDARDLVRLARTRCACAARLGEERDGTERSSAALDLQSLNQAHHQALQPCLIAPEDPRQRGRSTAQWDPRPPRQLRRVGSHPAGDEHTR